MAQTTPYAQEWLDMEAKLGGRSVLTGPPDAQREQFAGLGGALASMATPLPDTVDTEDVNINDNVRVRVYTPKDKTSHGSLPIGVYLHCGGFIMGSVEGDEYLVKIISMSVPSVMVSVEYRLAPEHKYPAAHDDSRAGLKWAVQNASKYGADPSKLYTIGMSAGGTLALALALGDSSVKGVVALGPPTVAPSQVPAHLKSLFKPEENTDSAIIDGAGMKVYSDAYGAPADSTDVSVLNHANLAKLPPTYLVVTGKDPLRDDGIALEQELKAKGVKVKSDHYDGFPHLFWIVPGLETGTTAVNNIVGGINWVLSEM